MAIVGKGDIAHALTDRDGVIFFASGVSNSSETDDFKFWREQDLLLQQPKDECLFYFSTISRFYPSPSAYMKHKMAMERIVQQWPRYVILRIGNINFGNNPHTFLNRLRSLKAKGEPFEVRDEWKFMITKEHLLMLTNHLPIDGKIEICAFTYMAKVKDLI